MAWKDLGETVGEVMMTEIETYISAGLATTAKEANRGRKMNSITEIGSNSSFVSIRKAPAQNVLPDTNEDQKIQTPILNLEALKIIGRLVRTFKARIESESRIVKKAN